MVKIEFLQAFKTSVILLITALLMSVFTFLIVMIISNWIVICANYIAIYYSYLIICLFYSYIGHALFTINEYTKNKRSGCFTKSYAADTLIGRTGQNGWSR